MRDKVINLIREIEKEYWSTCEETAEDNYKKFLTLLNIMLIES